MVDASAYNNWANVGKPETLRIILTLAGKTGQHAYQADVVTAYLNAYTKEKIFTVAGREFGELEGRVLLVRKALYGLATSANRWAIHLSGTLKDMGFERSRGDSALWYKFDKSGKVYDYIYTYVDDLTIVTHPERFNEYVEQLQKVYHLKDIGPLTHNLGLDYVRTDEGYYVCDPSKYVERAIVHVEEIFGDIRKYHTPMSVTTHPELDISPELGKDGIPLYQSMIGVLQWIQGIGRFDISYAVSMMSSYAAKPREGHMDGVVRIFGYLKRYPNKAILLSPNNPTVEDDGKNAEEYNEFGFYNDASEVIDPKHPYEIKDMEEIKMLAFVDADHAHNKGDRKSVSGYLIYFGSAPIRWLAKKQKSVSSSTYEAEYYALRILSEEISGLRYVIRSFGIPMNNSTTVLTDNKSVYQSSMINHSKLRAKHVAISYHKVREAIATKTINVTHVPTAQNLSDLLTKPLVKHRHHDLVMEAMRK